MFNVLLMCLEEKINFAIYLTLNWTSLVVQCLRICLPIKGTWVLSLTQEDPTCHGATKPMHHNYWVHALEPVSCSYWVWRPPLLSPHALEPLVCNKRSHHKDQTTHPSKYIPWRAHPLLPVISSYHNQSFSSQLGHQQVLILLCQAPCMPPSIKQP